MMSATVTLTVTGGWSGRSIPVMITANADGEHAILTIPRGLPASDAHAAWGAAEGRGWVISPISRSNYRVDGQWEHIRLNRLGTTLAGPIAYPTTEVKTVSGLRPSRAALTRSVSRN